MRLFFFAVGVVDASFIQWFRQRATEIEQEVVHETEDWQVVGPKISDPPEQIEESPIVEASVVLPENTLPSPTESFQHRPTGQEQTEVMHSQRDPADFPLVESLNPAVRTESEGSVTNDLFPITVVKSAGMPDLPRPIVFVGPSKFKRRKNRSTPLKAKKITDRPETETASASLAKVTDSILPQRVHSAAWFRDCHDPTCRIVEQPKSVGYEEEDDGFLEKMDFAFDEMSDLLSELLLY